MPSSVISLNFPVFTSAYFPRDNKHNHLDQYLNQALDARDKMLEAGSGLTERLKITDIVTLGSSEYEDFTRSLLTNRPWLSGKGGVQSDAVTTEDFFKMTDEERRIFAETKYRLCVAVQCEGRRTIFVDPQGYDYARYSGL